MHASFHSNPWGNTRPLIRTAETHTPMHIIIYSDQRGPAPALSQSQCQRAKMWPVFLRRRSGGGVYACILSFKIVCLERDHSRRRATTGNHFPDLRIHSSCAMYSGPGAGGVGPICEVPSLLPHANASAQLLFNINGGERYPAPHTTATPPRPPADRSLPDSEKQKRGITVTQAGGERSPQHL